MNHYETVFILNPKVDFITYLSTK